MKFDHQEDKERILKMCEVVIDSKLFSKMHAHKFIHQMVSFNLLSNYVLPLMQDALNSESFSPSYVHLSSHQELLGPLIHSLGFDMFERS